MINIFLDTIIYNFTPYKSFFFLININKKSLVYNISVGLFIDLFITHTLPFNTIFMIIFYLLHKFSNRNYYNVINYYLFNILTMFVYYLIASSIYNFKNIFLSMFVINSIFILISYIKDSKNIKLYRWYNGRIFKRSKKKTK